MTKRDRRSNPDGNPHCDIVQGDTNGDANSRADRNVRTGTTRFVSHAHPSIAVLEALAKPFGDLGYQQESWNNVEGYKVDRDAVRRWGVPLTTLYEFIAQKRDKFVIS